MQLCVRIYYSKVFWRFNMFRAAHRTSSGAPNCICSLWFICPYGDRPFFSPLSLGNGRSPYGHINLRLQIQFGAPDDERCAARNMLSLQKLWNNKFNYKSASYCYFYWVIYDARIHEYQNGFCNRDTGCDFRLLPRSKWDLRSSGLLRGLSF
jgi:hypothetical protein